MSPQESIVAVARSWLKTPYVLQGRIKGVAADCIGHVEMTGKECGYIPFDYEAPAYRTDIHGLVLLRECNKIMTRINAIELGCVVAMRFRGRDMAQHLAVVGNYRAGGWSLIQAMDSLDKKGRVVEHNLSSDSMKRIDAVYRMRWDM